MKRNNQTSMKIQRRKMRKRSFKMAEEEKVPDKIKRISNSIYKEIVAEQKPEISMPLRSLQNVTYDEKVGYFELDNKFKSRTLTASTVKTFAQTLKMMALSKTLVETDDIATKR